MSREIKFRAWDTKVRQPMWDHEGCLSLLLLHGRVLNGTAAEEGKEHLERFKIMQYTGLKDKNGKEIYEGDILRDDCNELHEVVFGKLPLNKSGDCVCTYEAFYCKCYGKLGQAPFYECQNIGEWMEIIGNIYEHSHLLDGKQ